MTSASWGTRQANTGIVDVYFWVMQHFAHLFDAFFSWQTILRTWLPIKIITKPDVKTGVGYQHYLGDRIWKILLMQKPLLRDSRSRSGWKAGLDVQPKALLLVHSISCSSTRGALSPLLWLLTPYSLLLPQNVCALSAGGRMGKNTYSNRSHLFRPLLFISGGGNIIPLLYIIPLL